MSNYVVIDGDRYDFKNVSKITEDSCSVCALKNFCNIEDTPCSVFNPSEIVSNRYQYAFAKHVKFQNNEKEIIKNKVMTKYIDKDVLLAEIERLQDSIKSTAIDGRISKEQAEAYKVCVKLRSFVEDTLEVKEINVELENENNNPKVTIGTKIRSKTNPDIILNIISDDCHGDEFECSNGSVLSLKQIEKYYDLII